MELWTSLLDILILLAGAMVLGVLFERLRQSPLLGYLLAGTLLGPNALDLLPSHAEVTAIAELGVALLLFMIGLEFSWRRLRAVGPIALGGGTLQLLITGLLAGVVSWTAGLSGRASVAVGAMIAFSSTAAVVRLLARRAEIDSVHGRNAVGILLLQDIAVVPLMLVIVAHSRTPPVELEEAPSLEHDKVLRRDGPAAVRMIHTGEHMPPGATPLSRHCVYGVLHHLGQVGATLRRDEPRQVGGVQLYRLPS